jgi:hypothetical protein
MRITAGNVAGDGNQLQHKLCDVLKTRNTLNGAKLLHVHRQNIICEITCFGTLLRCLYALTIKFC